MKAVEVMRGNDSYSSNNIQAEVWDIASEELPPGLQEKSVDIVMLIFIFSALSPSQWKQAVYNIYRILKPGGQVLFRDYGRGDLTQVRFKKARYLEENFYVRGDGTRVYYFEKEELIKLWTINSPCYEAFSMQEKHSQQLSYCFNIDNIGFDRRLLVNRAKQLKMYRCWIQASFRKPPFPNE